MSKVTVEGNLSGPLVVEVDTVFQGNLLGDLIVRSDCMVEMRGNLNGDIVLEGNAQADVQGNMTCVIRRPTDFASRKD